MEREQTKRIIEALLFTSDKPLSIAQIKEALEEQEPAVINSLIGELGREYIETGRSFKISEVAGGYRIYTDPEYAPWLRKLYRTSRMERLSHPALETLAIVAYRQPITRLEIEDIRGVSVDGVLRTLLEKALVRISGRKSIAGRPFLYNTTRQFLESFGLRSLEDLPKMEEFEAMIREDKTGGKEDAELKETTQEDRSD